jgi:hypothetical protein
MSPVEVLDVEQHPPELDGAGHGETDTRQAAGLE